MASSVYERCKANLMKGIIDLESDTIKVQLHTASYTPATTHNITSDLSNEVSATGYTAGGISITSGSVVTQGATTYWDSTTNPSWTITGSMTARYAVIVDVDATLGANSLIAWIDFGENKTCTDGTFTITWNASGIIGLA
jgi:hypothetical protein